MVRPVGMGINYQFLPNVVVGHALGLADPCMGSTLALSAERLARLGGFESLRDHLADDFELGRAIRAMGDQVVMPPMLVSHECDEKAAGELLSHELRWNRTIRMIDGAGYFGSIVTHGFPLAMIGAVLTGFSQVSLALVVAILVSRLILKLRIDAGDGDQGRILMAGSGPGCAIVRCFPGQPDRFDGHLARDSLSCGIGRGSCPHSEDLLMLRTLFMQAPSFDGFDGGAGSRYQAKREIKSFWYPTWLAQPAALVEKSKLVDAPPHKQTLNDVLPMAKDHDLLVLHTSAPVLRLRRQDRRGDEGRQPEPEGRP